MNPGRHAGIVDGLESARSKSSNRAGDQDAAGVAPSHVVSYPVNEVNGPGDVGIDHPPRLFEILVEERAPQAAPGIG